ncbi:MAG: T9SS type A sorting domain-containing protein [Bacteroidales bacterium]|nr:T9SS type A sorting domain-containing protein [Bacteroidales bacterium]
MKKLYNYLPLLALPLVFIFMGYHSGSPGGRTGSPGDNGNNCTSCHSGTPQNASDWIATDIPGNGYVGGETYLISATGTHSGVSRFGFELTAEDQNGNKVGTIQVTNATENQLSNAGKSITHTNQGITPTGNSKTWEFEWTAPEDVPGDVTFYAAFNAANGNGGTSGDVIYLSQKTYGPDVTGVAEVANNFRFYPNPSTGMVNLEIPDAENNSVSIYNQAGQLVQQLKMNNQFGRIDLSNQAKGIYFVQMGTNEMQKLIIR